MSYTEPPPFRPTHLVFFSNCHYILLFLLRVKRKKEGKRVWARLEEFINIIQSPPRILVPILPVITRSANLICVFTETCIVVPGTRVLLLNCQFNDLKSYSVTYLSRN